MIDVPACRAADAAEAAAYADMYAAAPAQMQAGLGLRVEALGRATLLIAPGMRNPLFNRVIGFGTFEEASEAALDVIVERYRAAGCTAFWLSVNAPAQSERIGSWLDARGFAPPTRRAWVQMHWPAASPPAQAGSSFDVAAVSRSEAQPLAELIATAFGMPASMAAWLVELVGRNGWCGIAARDGARIVGGSLVYVAPPLAWLGMGSVLPSHRGRGGQLALMAARIAHAQAQGCTAIHTETGEPIGDEPNPSLANMRRAGFETIGSRPNFELRLSV